jgi:AcrR family transcriptional regulator
VTTAQDARRSAPLDRAAILAAAVELVDRQGLAGLNMRALAQALDVGTMSLYHYVPNKDALLDGIVESLMLEIELPVPADGSWDQRALRMARSLREVALRHPNCVPLMVTRPFATPAALVPANAAFGLLAEAGLDAEQALITFRAIVAYVFGFVMMESAGFFASFGNAPDPDHLRGLGLEELAGVVPKLQGRDVGADFEAGFHVVLFGSSQINPA